MEPQTIAAGIMLMHLIVAVGIMLMHLLFILGFMLFGICALAFWIWMLVDCLNHESSDGNDKIVWTLVIVFANWLGALIYFFVRRKERTRTKTSTPPRLPPQTQRV